MEKRWDGDFGKAQISAFTGCGWPDLSTYRKDECMERLKKLLHAHLYKTELPVF